MDGMPQPVNLSALQGLLAKSKQVMQKVEGDMPTPTRRESMNESYSNIYDSGFYNENDEREPVYESYLPSNPNETEYQAPTDYTAEMVQNSRLPDAIKAIMIAKPIPQVSMTGGVSVEQIARMTRKNLNDTKQAPQALPPRQQPIRENIQQPRGNSEMITISKTELKDMINEGISTFFKQIYDKTLTEETIKKTITTLIKEGIIPTKKKTI